jgi:hypothetical protein
LTLALTRAQFTEAIAPLLPGMIVSDGKSRLQLRDHRPNATGFLSINSNTKGFSR